MDRKNSSQKKAALIGAGPAGLFAADCLIRAGFEVDIYDRHERAGGKFLLAGKSGLNITNDENPTVMAERYGVNELLFRSLLEGFSSDDLRDWLKAMDVETFRGNGGKIFPKDISPGEILLLWLDRLEKSGSFHYHGRCEWIGWKGGKPLLSQEGKDVSLNRIPLLFALGGGSWTGSKSWPDFFEAQEIGLTPFKPMNCSFRVDWSDRFNRDHWDRPVKNVALKRGDVTRRGDLLLTKEGIEGGPVYWFSLPLREALEEEGEAVLYADLMPDLSREDLELLLTKKSRKKSLSSYLKGTMKLPPEKLSLLMEFTTPEERVSPALLAGKIKLLPLRLTGTGSLERAISTSGGISMDSLDEFLMIKSLPGYFVAGEMADWEAPTGGYLLQGCFATAYRAAEGMKRFCL
ncbi:MAG: TIGR03862 family flavoprotein [Spirochaetales bacterium]|nr:TIGR03862 family flavoprotein [Spirochaetales bacterium]